MADKSVVEPSLKKQSQWPDWYTRFEYEANTRGIWVYCNPDGADQANPTLSPPTPPIYHGRAPSSIDTPLASTEASSSSSSTMPMMPVIAPMLSSEAHQAFVLENRIYSQNYQVWTTLCTHYRVLETFVRTTTDPAILGLITKKLVLKKDFSLQAIVRSLRDHYAPHGWSVQAQVRREYQEMLNKARRGGVNPITWYSEWENAYLRARTYDIPDVSGTLAIEDFLQAVSAKMAPTWGRTEHAKLLGEDTPSRSLEDYGLWFHRLAESDAQAQKGQGIFATLGGRSDDATQSKDTTVKSPSKISSPTDGIKAKCPCQNPNYPIREATHRWAPQECFFLEFALTGSSNGARRPGKEQISAIKNRLNQKEWTQLRKDLQEKGWLGGDKSKSTGQKSGTNGTSNSVSQQKFKGDHVSAATIDSTVMSKDHGVSGIYSTMDFSRHPFADSTLLDNCGATHLVNNKALLVQDSFVQSTHDEFVEAGTQALPIIGRGKRMFVNALQDEQGNYTRNLTITNVAVVYNFHVNIISEKRLADAGIWYCGKDCSLRQGEVELSLVVKSLERRSNLVFFEYKQLSSYPSSLPVIPVSACEMIMANSDRRNHVKVFQRSREAQLPRTDSANLWHLRSGHLGQEALEQLVWSVRNVKIEGIKRAKCEHCAQAHASQVISRRASERKSMRPFWRIQWDLFDFPQAHDGTNWLLMIKDEFSGKLFGYLLQYKTTIEVLCAVQAQVRWVKTQYGLQIAKIKHDNDTSVISTTGSTEYQVWTEEQGIEIELPPTYTHEPNGGAERAGQEVITRSIKMRIAAGLPENLWAEAALAAIYLYNISPSKANNWRTPNQQLDSWFQQYFRWYRPELVSRLTTDLRPNWSNIYAYGARAYPLIKDREAGRAKRAFKVKPRGHVGYLVGYQASNIFRIWVPSIEEVIITRNVTFDESIFYSKGLEQQDGQPVAITRDVVELLREEDSQGPGIMDDQLQDVENDHLNQTNAQPTGQAQHPPSQDRTLRTNSGVRVEIPVRRQTSTGLQSPRATPERFQDRVEQSGAGQLLQQEADAQLAARATQDLFDVDQVPTTQTRSAQQTFGLLSKPDAGQLHQEDEPSAQSAARAPEALLKGAGERQEPRRSARIRVQRSKGDSVSGPGVFSTHEIMSEALDAAKLRSESLITLLPDQWMWNQQTGEQIRTMFAVIAASIHPSDTDRLTPTSTRRIHQSDLIKLPQNWKELDKHPLGDLFKEDAEREIATLDKKNCWRIVENSEVNSKVIPLKWVFTYKLSSDGFLERCKSRIVVRGDLQEKNTIESTYAATLAARSFRLAMALVAQFDLEALQYDVIQAFINANRDTSNSPVVCTLPEGFKQPGKCVVIQQALYGLRDSPALWYKEFSSTLSKLGLTMCANEPCMFTHTDRKVFIIFFVDDILILFHKNDGVLAQSIINGIKKVYEIRSLGNVEWFLGVRVIRDRSKRKLWLAHDTYIDKITKKFDITKTARANTPLPVIEFVKNKDQTSADQIKLYQEKVGSILYTAITIRADVAFAASQLSRFLTNPSTDHMYAADHCLRYLRESRYLAIQYGSASLDAEAQLIIASDTSFADDPETRRSSQGYTMSLFGGLIVWRASRQDTVATSTTEAELLGMERTSKEAMALNRLFKEISLDLGEVMTIFCDNQQTIRLIVGEQERISTKLRHVDIQNMWLRQEHGKGSFKVLYLPTADMPADGLTKNLRRQPFERFKDTLNMVDIEQLIAADQKSS